MRSRSLFLTGLFLLSGCAMTDAGQPEGPDTPDSPDSLDSPELDGKVSGVPYPEDSDAARAILRVVNWATADELLDQAAVGLYPKPAANVAAYRAGPDGLSGTPDDRTIQTLAELDGISWVGLPTFHRLLGYAGRHGFDLPPACDATAPRKDPIQLLVNPDDGNAAVKALIDGARRSVDVTIYEMSSTGVIDALAAAVTRGVRVRVILDGKQDQNVPLVARLQAKGIEAQLSSASFVYTHQKTVLVDDRRVLVSTGNLDNLSFFKGRNYSVVETDWQDLADLRELFEADWTGRVADLACTRLVVSPVNSRQRILDLIAATTTSLDIEALYLTDRPLVDAVLAARARGVAVRAVLNDPSFGFSDDAVGKELAAAGVEARRSGALFIHAKVMVFDGARVFLGSENFSRNSLSNNREVGLVAGGAEVDLARLVATFEADFAGGVPF